MIEGGGEPGQPLAGRDDEALMELAAADYREAFAALVDRHLRGLHSYAIKFLGNALSAEEVAQDVLLRVWADRRSYRAQGRFTVYLFTLCRNRCFNRLRDERRRPGPPREPPRPVDPGAAPEQLDRILDDERRRRVEEAVLRLPPKLREAILLRFDLGLDYAVIARILGCPVATARSRVFLAVRRLRAETAEEVEP
jgi:RNA polymerase sigma-70 factor (ECF subfamily)